MEKFKFRNALVNNVDVSPYSFQLYWDKNSIKNAIENSKKNKDLPNFYLSKIEIHPTSFCNMNCRYCYGSNLRPKEKEEIDLIVVENMLKDIRENMPNEQPLIILSGLYSEPLAHSKIKEIIKLIGDYEFRFAVYTNLLLLDDELIKILVYSAGKNKDAMPSYLSINASSSLESGRVELLLEKIKKINDYNKQKKLQVNANILFLEDKHQAIKNIIKEFDIMGVDNLRISIPWNKINENSQLKYSLNKKEYAEKAKILENLKKLSGIITIRTPENNFQTEKCYVMSLSLSIDSSGYVYPCPERTSQVFRKKFSYGNIAEKPLSKIWRSEEHKKLWRRINPKKENCSCCPLYARLNEFCENLDRD